MERGVEVPDSRESGEVEREERYILRRLKKRYSVLRFTNVPPNNRETTTSGSINAPAPIVTITRAKSRQEETERPGCELGP